MDRINPFFLNSKVVSEESGHESRQTGAHSIKSNKRSVKPGKMNKPILPIPGNQCGIVVYQDPFCKLKPLPLNSSEHLTDSAQVYSQAATTSSGDTASIAGKTVKKNQKERIAENVNTAPEFKNTATIQHFTKSESSISVNPCTTHCKDSVQTDCHDDSHPSFESITNKFLDISVDAYRQCAVTMKEGSQNHLQSIIENGMHIPRKLEAAYEFNKLLSDWITRKIDRDTAFSRVIALKNRFNEQHSLFYEKLQTFLHLKCYKDIFEQKEMIHESDKKSLLESLLSPVTDKDKDFSCYADDLLTVRLFFLLGILPGFYDYVNYLKGFELKTEFIRLCRENASEFTPVSFSEIDSIRYLKTRKVDISTILNHSKSPCALTNILQLDIIRNTGKFCYCEEIDEKSEFQTNLKTRRVINEINRKKYENFFQPDHTHTLNRLVNIFFDKKPDTFYHLVGGYEWLCDEYDIHESDACKKLKSRELKYLYYNDNSSKRKIMLKLLDAERRCLEIVEKYDPDHKEKYSAFFAFHRAHVILKSAIYQSSYLNIYIEAGDLIYSISRYQKSSAIEAYKLYRTALCWPKAADAALLYSEYWSGKSDWQQEYWRDVSYHIREMATDDSISQPALNEVSHAVECTDTDDIDHLVRFIELNDSPIRKKKCKSKKKGKRKGVSKAKDTDQKTEITMAQEEVLSDKVNMPKTVTKENSRSSSNATRFAPDVSRPFITSSPSSINKSDVSLNLNEGFQIVSKNRSIEPWERLLSRNWNRKVLSVLKEIRLARSELNVNSESDIYRAIFTSPIDKAMIGIERIWEEYAWSMLHQFDAVFETGIMPVLSRKIAIELIQKVKDGYFMPCIGYFFGLDSINSSIDPDTIHCSALTLVEENPALSDPEINQEVRFRLRCLFSSMGHAESLLALTKPANAANHQKRARKWFSYKNIDPLYLASKSPV